MFAKSLWGIFMHIDSGLAALTCYLELLRFANYRTTAWLLSGHVNVCWYVLFFLILLAPHCLILLFSATL